MSQPRLEILPEAVEEAAAARAWYEERSPTAAKRFVKELDHAVRRILESPKLWPSYLHGTRRYLLRRFPYVVVYREENDRTLILAVAHCKRRPGYWKNRGPAG